MTKYASHEITRMQFIFLIHGAQMGLGVLSLPREVAEIAGTDGWISILIGWLLAILCSLCIVGAMKRHPEDTLFELLGRYFGKYIGTVLKVVFIAYFMLALITSLYSTAFILKTWILPKTPGSVILLLLAVPVYTVARGSIRVLGRYAELVFWAFAWLPLVLLLTLQDGHWLHLLPVLKEGWKPVLLAVKATVFPFTGFETLFILYPYLQKKEKAVSAMIIANTLTMVEYMIAVILCYVNFSPAEILTYQWPLLRLVKVVELRILERLEIPFLVSYMMVVSRIWIFYLHYAALGTSKLLRTQDHRPPLRVLLAGCVLASFFFFPSFQQLETLLQWSSSSGIVCVFAFPVLLYLYTNVSRLLRRRW